MVNTVQDCKQLAQICGLAISNQQLISKCLDMGLVYDAKQFMQADRLIAALYALASKKYNPNQPRVPAGNPNGGQWTDDPRWGGSRPSEADEAVITPMSDITEEMIPVSARNEPPEPITSLKKYKVPHPDGTTPKVVNIFMGGKDDAEKYKNVLNSNSLKQNVYGTNYYAEHRDSEKIKTLINQIPKDTTINLIGHSWGGDTAAYVVLDKPGRIDNLITIDPVSLFPPSYLKVSNGVLRWVNVNAVGTPGSSRFDSDRLFQGGLAAGFGSAWNDSPAEFADEHIKAPYNHSGFDNMMDYAPAKEKSPIDILNE